MTPEHPPLSRMLLRRRWKIKLRDEGMGPSPAKSHRRSTSLVQALGNDLLHPCSSQASEIHEVLCTLLLAEAQYFN